MKFFTFPMALQKKGFGFIIGGKKIAKGAAI